MSAIDASEVTVALASSPKTARTLAKELHLRKSTLNKWLYQHGSAHCIVKDVNGVWSAIDPSHGPVAHQAPSARQSKEAARVLQRICTVVCMCLSWMLCALGAVVCVSAGVWAMWCKGEESCVRDLVCGLLSVVRLYQEECSDNVM